MAGISEIGEAVQSLLYYGTDEQRELPADAASVTLGSAEDRDIVIRSGFVSADHCRLDRDGLRWWVTDEGSKNGTFVAGVREHRFELRPGTTFTVGALPHRLLALDHCMCHHYPELMDILGDQQEHEIRSDTPSPSEMIVTAATDEHLLLTGPRGCGQRRLAFIVHEMSRYRSRPAVVRTEIPADRSKQTALVNGEAAASTLVLDIGDEHRPVDARFAAIVFSSKSAVRVITLAPSLEAASRVFGERNVRLMRHYCLRPLSYRPGAALRILDRRWLRRGSPLRTSAMTAENQYALRIHDWPDNLDSLREAEIWLATIDSLGNLNKALQYLGIPSSSFYYWYNTKMRLSHPLTNRRHGV